MHIVFDYLDKLYCETSEINEYKSSNLFKIHYPWFFKDLIKTFIDYNSKFEDETDEEYEHRNELYENESLEEFAQRKAKRQERIDQYNLQQLNTLRQ